MKYWVSHLPLEVWVERIKSPNCQHKLILSHLMQEDEARIAIDSANARQVTIQGGWHLQMFGRRKDEPNGEKLDFVQTPMPENIKLFERIEIKHFDSSTLDFLHRISTLFTNNDVNLRLGFFNDNMANLRTVLDHLLPLLHGIHSLTFEQNAILRNRYFSDILQYCLHERGKRTLDWLDLDKDATIPRTPMPENIKFFEKIMIWHFDSSTIDFLHQISTLFNDVNLRLGIADDLANFRTILDHLSPLLHGIHSLRFKQNAIPLVQQYFGPKLAQVRLLTILIDYQAPIQASIDFCLNWLNAEGRDPTDEPRLLKVHICGAEIFEQFCMATKQQFLSANSPRTFAIGFFCCHNDDDHMVNFHLVNTMGEQLDGQIVGYGDYQIYRHKQVDSAREHLEEWVNETAEKANKSSGIELYQTATIGPIEENAGPNEVGDNAGEEAEDQPSTSKKPKMT